MAAVVFGSDKTRAAMENLRAMEKAATEASRGIYVYLHCFSKSSHQVWYRFKFGDEEFKEKLKPVARLPRCYNCGDYSSWTFAGNDIYYNGMLRHDSFVPVILKHTIHDHDESDHSDLEEWKTEGSEPPLPFWHPLFAPDVAHKKLYLVGGPTRLDQYGELPDDTPCGLVYDIVAKTWTPLLGGHLGELISYYVPYEASVVLKGEGNEAGPMEFVFFSLRRGTLLFLSVAEASVKLLESAVHDQLKLFPSSEFDSPPQTCLSDVDFFSLQCIASCMPAVVIDRTIYWFSLDMCLYGYDSKAKTWIKSECLEKHFLKPYYSRNDSQMPLLLGLPESQMLVILPTSEDEFTITLLKVVADKTVTTSLSVLVGATHGYCFDDPYVTVIDGKAI